MDLWEELDSCKYGDNEYLVDHLIEVVKDEGINSLNELEAYELKYFSESNMTKEEWVKWYEDSFKNIPEIENADNDPVAIKIKQLREEISNTLDTNLKIRNIIMICALLEREFCFLVEAYNLIVGGEVTFNEDMEACRTVVLCGSMKVKDEILNIQKQLQDMGFNVLIPVECMMGEPKAVASRAHFDRIANPSSSIVLVVNATKGDIPNYIGPNTFAEIAFGFYHRKNVVLLNRMYEPYREELQGWGVVCLNGILESINHL